MLESDLRMKRTGAHYTDPRSHTGKVYWSELEGLAGPSGGEIKGASRFWIVPGNWSVEVDESSVYVNSVKLHVLTEAQYLAGVGDGADGGSRQGDPNDDPTVFLDRLTRETTQPHIEKMVNESADYADIRAAAHAIAVSILYRKCSVYGFHPFTIGIGRSDVGDRDPPVLWSAMATWEEYVKLYEDGVYRIPVKEEVPGGHIVHLYFHGGVNMEDWPPPQVGSMTSITARLMEELVDRAASDGVATAADLRSFRVRNAHEADVARDDLPGFGPHRLLVENDGKCDITVRLRGSHVFQATAQSRSQAELRLPDGTFRVYLKISDGRDSIYLDYGDQSYESETGYSTRTISMAVDRPLERVRFDSASTITAQEYAAAGRPLMTDLSLMVTQ